MHVKEEIIDRITFMNDYLEPYEDMSAYSFAVAEEFVEPITNALCKTIRFSHDPRNFTGTSLYNEWEYLKKKYGYIDLLPVGDFWYGIR